MRSRILLVLPTALLALGLLTSCSDDGYGGGDDDSPTFPECGNGTVETGEECDDGNVVPGDGCDADCNLESILVIDGEYDLSISLVRDTCGFGAAPTDAPMQVQELDPVTAEVDIPAGGAGGDCNRQDFARAGNTLTLLRLVHQQIGACFIQVDVITELTFSNDAGGIGVTGSETNAVTATGGDCSGLNLPCSIELAVGGATCSGCFFCVDLPAPAGRLSLGPLGNGAVRP
jgi:cysteine-rich repeat protein